jgi:hypothetical protein
MTRARANFVVGTGRCGSTLLSKLLAEHPAALVLSEFFGGLDMLNRFREGDVTALELKEILSRDMELSHFWKTRSKKIAELLVDHGSIAARWNGHVPVLLEIALPALTRDSDLLFQEMMDWAQSRSIQPLSRHYPELFEWLMRKFGRSMWIERSGASFEFIDGLNRTFPNARFVHIHRDGREAALSMMEHAHFREIVSYHYDPPTAEELRRTALHLDPAESDPFRRRVDGPQSLSRYAEYWSYSIARGYSVLPRIGAENFLEIRFEDLLADPPAVLRQVAAFFQMPDDAAWIARAVKHIKGEVPSRAGRLHAAEQAELDKGCYYGQLLLRRDLTPSPVIEATRVVRGIFDEQRAGKIPPQRA